MTKLMTVLGVPILLLASGTPALAQDNLELGVAALAVPAHLGADDKRTIILPMIDARRGRLFANLTEGVGADVRLGPVTLGGAMTYLIGYRERDVPQGVGRLSDGVAARLFARASVGGAVVTIGANKGFAGGTGGATADATIHYPLPLSQRLMIAPTAGIAWADRRHNDRYFGIDAAQSSASGLDRYAARQGLGSVSAGLNARYALTSRVTLNAAARVDRLLPAVSRSPLVRHRATGSLIIALAYRF